MPRASTISTVTTSPQPNQFISPDDDVPFSQVDMFKDVLGNSPIMQDIFQKICLVAPTNATVLLIGESGTGKEIAAHLIHDLSKRSDAMFLPLNCGALSPQLVESELFGHQKGSFTGALRDHKGYFECAAGGTLFLDEITEMPVDLQVKLLRVLETQQVMRIGSAREISTDVRIIAATNRCPLHAVKEGRLREDLFYRLQVFPIDVPRLACHIEDIELLANRFLEELNEKFCTIKYFNKGAIESLQRYSWPGNVRELKNVVHRAYIMSEQCITDLHIPKNYANDVVVASGTTVAVPIGTSLSEVERCMILATLEKFKGDKEKTAHTLEISLKTLYNKLNTYQLISSKSA